MDSIFFQMSLVLVLAFAVSVILKALKQPLIVGYIITGIALTFLGISSYTSSISSLAQMGIIILLFLVGLNLNPRVIKEVGKVSVITAIGQFILTFIPLFLISRYFGFSNISSIYISIAVTFSSTVIITKLLFDKGDLETLYGRISVGFLIMQDLIAIFFLMIISLGEISSRKAIFCTKSEISFFFCGGILNFFGLCSWLALRPTPLLN